VCGIAQFFHLENLLLAVDRLDDQHWAFVGLECACECFDQAERIFPFQDAEKIKAKEKHEAIGQT
jgi:hypothetical protein